MLKVKLLGGGGKLMAILILYREVWEEEKGELNYIRQC
jgi:hypothetical protein